MKLLALFGLVIPEDVIIGENAKFAHNAIGRVIAHNTIIGDDVKIYQNVTVGRANIKGNSPVTVEIQNNAIICAGAKVLAKDYLIVGENTIVAANAVLLSSTECNEI